MEEGNERLQHVGEKCSNLGSYNSTTRRGTSANSTNLSLGRRPEPKSVEFADVPLLYYRDVGDFRAGAALGGPFCNVSSHLRSLVLGSTTSDLQTGSCVTRRGLVFLSHNFPFVNPMSSRPRTRDRKIWLLGHPGLHQPKPCMRCLLYITRNP